MTYHDFRIRNFNYLYPPLSWPHLFGNIHVHITHDKYFCTFASTMIAYADAFVKSRKIMNLLLGNWVNWRIHILTKQLIITSSLSSNVRLLNMKRLIKMLGKIFLFPLAITNSTELFIMLIFDLWNNDAVAKVRKNGQPTHVMTNKMKKKNVKEENVRSKVESHH